MTPPAETRPIVYILVWLALMVLLALTVGSAFMPLGAAHTPVILAISVTQASLVMLFSMHLSSAHPLMRVIAIIGFFGIAIMITLSLFDVLTR
jgi:cytochrome c oxidase subunit 4